MADIQTESDIHQLVEVFYMEVRKDVLLGPVFKKMLKGNWEQELATMKSYWCAYLSSHQNHSRIKITIPCHHLMHPHHFKRWLDLFNKSMGQLFEGSQAELIKNHAATIVEIINCRLYSTLVVDH